MPRFLGTFALISLLATATPALAQAAVEYYEGDGLRLELTPRQTPGYTGTVVKNGERYPLATTEVRNDRMLGQFTAGGTNYNFEIRLGGNGTMTFSTGKTTYQLKSVAAPRPAGNNLGNDVVRLSRVPILDPMCNNQTAATMLAPSDWKTDGGVIWRWNAFAATALHMRFYNPRGPEQLAYYPGLIMVTGVRESVYKSAIINGPEIAAAAAAPWRDGAFYMGSEIRPVEQDPVRTMQNYIIPRLRKDLVNAKVVDVKDLPELAKTAVAAVGGGPGVSARVSRVRLAYDLNGVAAEEDFYLTLTVAANPMVQPIVAWTVEVVSCRAAKGELDSKLPLYIAMYTSAKVDIKWFAGVQQVQNNMQGAIRQNIEDAGRLSRYISQKNDEITAIIRESYQNQQRSRDRTNDAFSQYIRGVERYTDPTDNTKTWDLPSGYRHAYYSPRGEIILSNDSNFDPAVEFKEDWKPMPKVRG